MCQNSSRRDEKQHMIFLMTAIVFAWLQWINSKLAGLLESSRQNQFLLLLGAIKTTLLSWSLNWASPPSRRKGGQKRATDTPFWEQPQNVPALNQRQMSWPHPDTTKFLLPRVASKRKISIAPPLPLISTCTSPFACAILLPHPSCWKALPLLLVHLNLGPCSIHWNLDVTQTASMCHSLHKVLISLYPSIWFLGEGPLETLE